MNKKRAFTRSQVKAALGPLRQVPHGLRVALSIEPPESPSTLGFGPQAFVAGQKKSKATAFANSNLDTRERTYCHVFLH